MQSNSSMTDEELISRLIYSCHKESIRQQSILESCPEGQRPWVFRRVDRNKLKQVEKELQDLVHHDR